jgi:hypothetical protein
MLTEVSAFISTAFHYYVLGFNFPSKSNLKKVRDDAFSDFWTKATGRSSTLAAP